MGARTRGQEDAVSATDMPLHEAAEAVFAIPWYEIWVVEPTEDDHDLRILAANAAAARAVGRRAEDLVGSLASRAYSPAVLGHAVTKVRAALRAGEPLRYRWFRELPDQQFVLSALLVPISRDRVVVVVRDHSNEFDALRQLDDLEDLAGIGCWRRNALDGTLAWSSGYRRILGVDDDEPATVERLLASIHPEDRAVMADRLRDECHGELSDLEFRIVRPNGEMRHLYGRVEAAVDDRGRRVRLFGTVQDVTEQRQTERRVRRIEQAEQRQSHALDLNDHIVQGLSAAQLALQLGQVELATETVQRTLQRAQQVVKDLLDLASGNGYIEPGDLVSTAPTSLFDEDER